MQIRFWGVRGSLPTPLTSSQIKEKMSAILAQALPEDIATAESRERFVAALPPWLFGTVGGNSPCVSVHFEGSNEPIIFDCGSGIREMGLACLKEQPMALRYYIFFSHFHWDHIQGFPFFVPAYNPSATVNFFSPEKKLKNHLFGQMGGSYFPVPMDYMAARQNFYVLEKPLSIGLATISFRKMNHPGGSYAYLVCHNGKRFIYATDTELSTPDFFKTQENIDFFQNADVIVLDSQYTLGEAIEKHNWGHNAFSLSVDFAVSWGIKHLVLFHHDPAYDDIKLHGVLQAARWYLQRMDVHNLEVSLATEGLEIAL